ncbi:UNVERIFIED_CONTAM: hypothetical protein RMT77_000345 [Armadillidium vulgare]
MLSIDFLKTPSGILKIANFVLLIITIAVFYSDNQDWKQFVGTTLVSAFVYIIFLTLTYILGGMEIQKTFYEITMNIYFSIIFFSSAIVSWINGVGGIYVTTGIFCLFCFILFSVDIYFALGNAGVFGISSRQTQQTPPTHVPPPVINMNTAGAFPSSVINPSVQDTGPAVIPHNNYQ